MKEEVKQAIPQFYVAGAEEEFLKLREQKEEEWKFHSEEEQQRLREVLDDLQKEIQEQREMAASILDDVEDVHKIENSDMPDIDEETQKKYEESMQQKMEERMSAKIESEDKKRKWLLDEVIFPKAFDFYDKWPQNTQVFILATFPLLHILS